MIHKDAFTRKISILVFFISFVLVLCLYSRQLYAKPIVDEAFFFEPKNHIEVSTAYENLSPHDVYGNWKTVSLEFERKEAPDLTWFAGVDNFQRKSRNGFLGEVGVYKDWNDSFYTYTALSGGTSSDYLPKARIDQELHFKFGSEKQYVWNVGGSYIKYFGDHRDNIISTGLTTYINKWSIGYQIFRNISNPGSVKSYSQEWSISYGKERQQLTTLTYSYGNQAYLATEISMPEAVDDKSNLVTLNHRHWLGIDHGYFAEVNRFNLKNGYRSTGISFGIFSEF